MEDYSNSNQQFEANDAPSQNNASEPVFVSEKKKTNVLALVLGVMASIFAIVAIVFLVKYFTEKPKCETVVTDQGEADEVKITTKVMAEEYKEVYDLVNELTSEFSRRSYANETSYTRVNDTNVFVTTKFSLLSKIVSDDLDTDMSAIRSDLTAAGFEDIGILPFVGSAGPEIHGYLNDKTDTICNIYPENEWVYDGVWQRSIYFSCGKISWTWLTDEETELISELGAAYQNKTSQTSPIAIDVQSISIKDSEYEPYQTLRVSLGGGIGKFYRTSPDSKWQFFVVTQAPLYCSEYDTDDLKKAFLGEVCYNDSQESTVQL